MTITLQIRKLVEAFRKEVIDNECPKGKCFTTCYPLSIHLDNNGFPNSIVQGHFDIITQGHYWLKLNDYDIIIDPTITQFESESNEPVVFVDKATKKYYPTPNITSRNFTESVSAWKAPFHVETRAKLPEGLISEDFNKRTVLLIILKAATLLHIEIENLKLKNKPVSKKSNFYFDNINEILVAWENIGLIKNLEQDLPKEFKTVWANAKKLLWTLDYIDSTIY
ncbi:MAG TPA: hypothetical protein VK718_06140 [Ferruginibacter sp.]|jgi:hypothetical protein|nr:hypothetical protein [Ferruginibacter sp.]